jgi:predicted RNA-binding Zn ribbon-like protein
MVTPAAKTESYVFDFSGGRLCLDFANTVSDRGGEHPRDHLQSYGDFIAWAEQGGAVPPALARDLLRRAAAHPADARRALSRAQSVREAIFHLFAAVSAARKPRPADLALLNEEIPAAFGQMRVAAANDEFVLKPDPAPDDLAFPLTPVVKSAVDLLTSADLDRVRTCAADTCEWLFLDTTKNRTRRWCDMKICGNREKVRRFRTRA